MSTPNYEIAMKNAGHIFLIEAMHRKTNTGRPDFVELYPYFEAYSEIYDSNWKVEDIYGRIDGIANYNSTKRTFNFTIRIVAWDLGQAKENQYKISKMIQFLYPAIGKKDNINNIRTAPILRITLGSLIFNASAGKEGTKTTGLYGFINGGFNIQPIHKDGYYVPSGLLTTVDSRREASTNDVVIFWKHVDISFNFTVLHDHPLGEDIEDEGASRSWKEYFPYGVGSADFAGAKKELDYTDDPSQTLANPFVIEEALRIQQLEINADILTTKAADIIIDDYNKKYNDLQQKKALQEIGRGKGFK